MGAGQTAAARRCALVAARHKAFDGLHELLGSNLSLLPADSLGKALRTLQSRIDVELIICSVDFDRSRMFDLLRLAKHEFSEIPFVCCRVFDPGMTKISLEALQIASVALGAATFIDVPGLTSRYGEDVMREMFLASVLKHLPAQASGVEI